MSKRVYKLDINDVSEALSNYLRHKFIELKDVGEADMVLKFNRRTGEMTVEIEV